MVKNMKNSVNLTFGIPVYNSEKYIEELLDCFKQKAVINYEILIVNDGSTDNSLNIINTYNNKNIRVITKENGGVSSARNCIIENARGNWITFVDADDLIDFDKYVDIFKKIVNSEYDYVICMNDKKSYERAIHDKQDRSFIIEKNIINSPWQKFYKKNILKKYDLKFDNKVSLGEDALFNIQYSFYTNNTGYYYENLYKYRDVNIQSLSKKFKDNKFEELMYVNTHSRDFTKSTNEKKALEYIRILNCRGCLYSMLKYKECFPTFNDKYLYIKKLKKYKKISYIFLNGFNQTIKYYSWYLCPSFLILIELYIYSKINKI